MPSCTTVLRSGPLLMIEGSTEGSTLRSLSFAGQLGCGEPVAMSIQRRVLRAPRLVWIGGRYTLADGPRRIRRYLSTGCLDVNPALTYNDQHIHNRAEEGA